MPMQVDRCRSRHGCTPTVDQPSRLLASMLACILSRSSGLSAQLSQRHRSLSRACKTTFQNRGRSGGNGFRSQSYFSACSADSSEENPVGVEWILMEYMPGVELGKALWKALQYDKKTQFAVDLVDMYDQLSQPSLEHTVAVLSITVLKNPRITSSHPLLLYPGIVIHRDGNPYRQTLFGPSGLIVTIRFTTATGFMRSVLSKIVLYYNTLS
ncbi:hypothetical protein PILCRDRAFT_184936 [Piloderma croceum F 1598]|uniref:Uncharacterized protein n=1 Tax=Piloderma croceum (strain F 1598) TaxID=765440 RepID=A0A0C3CLE5_PILCF|nr:hypothetical protein PILCRDRAFT_184936 [Piloderma croceum F 1598]